VAAKRRNKPVGRWEYFIAHSSRDKAAAERLYDLLASSSRVFLDSRCLRPGDDWDVELPKHQKLSKMTVVLISANTQGAYYQREEIAAAIALARRAPTHHRVIPIFLDQVALHSEEVPYGLRLKHAIVLDSPAGLYDAAQILLHERTRGVTRTVPPAISPAQVSVVERTGQKNRTGRKGYTAITRIRIRGEHTIRLELTDDWFDFAFTLIVNGDVVASGSHGLLSSKSVDERFVIEDRQGVFTYRAFVTIAAVVTVDGIEVLRA